MGGGEREEGRHKEGGRRGGGARNVPIGPPAAFWNMSFWRRIHFQTQPKENHKKRREKIPI